MVEYEADDALAAAAVMAAADDRVERVVICTPDKDLGPVRAAARSGSGTGARTSGSTPPGCDARLGVPPASIPDLLALVGDSADGFPGLPGWGAKSAAAVLRPVGPPRGHPGRPGRPGTPASAARAKLNAVLREQFELALLFRRIATVETDAPVSGVGRRVALDRSDATDVSRPCARRSARPQLAAERARPRPVERT